MEHFHSIIHNLLFLIWGKTFAINHHILIIPNTLAVSPARSYSTLPINLFRGKEYTMVNAAILG